MASPSLEESLAPRRSLVCKFLQPPHIFEHWTDHYSQGGRNDRSLRFQACRRSQAWAQSESRGHQRRTSRSRSLRQTLSPMGQGRIPTQELHWCGMGDPSLGGTSKEGSRIQRRGFYCCIGRG